MIKGSKHSLESKKKLSDSHKGLSSPNKGKIVSLETREKLRKSHIGKSLSLEHKQKISQRLIGNKYCVGRIPWNKGIPWSEEIKNKMSESAKKRLPFSDETKRKLSISRRKRILTIETKNKISKAHTGRKHTLQSRFNMSLAHKGQISHNKGKKASPETRQKQRISAIKRCGYVYPGFNKTACKYFKWLDDNIFYSNGQYATNGGEYLIKELGYWLDYINHDLKLIIEWDEKSHYRNGKLKEKDIQRQKEIEAHFPDYDFIRIRESELQIFLIYLIAAMQYKNLLPQHGVPINR